MSHNNNNRSLKTTFRKKTNIMRQMCRSILELCFISLQKAGCFPAFKAVMWQDVTINITVCVSKYE